jgi:uncharacterized protein (TIGR04255 family)
MTDVSSSVLPDYSDPPVIEVALSVQFDPIPGFGVPQIGVLWQRFRNNFPIAEEYPPIAHATEEFGVRLGPRITLNAEVLSQFPTPRVWFLNAAGSELVQIQTDRLIFNWRRMADNEEYPRYVHVRSKFDDAVRELRAFLSEEGLPDIQPDQCEVTYVNHFRSGTTWEHHGQADRVVTVWNGRPRGDLLQVPEDVRFAMRYIISEHDSVLGRLHVAFEPAYRLVDNEPMLLLTLIARGAPVGDGLSGVGRFLDIGHEWIVRGFTSLTTAEMHRIWGRRNGD